MSEKENFTNTTPKCKSLPTNQPKRKFTLFLDIPLLYSPFLFAASFSISLTSALINILRQFLLSRKHSFLLWWQWWSIVLRVLCAFGKLNSNCPPPPHSSSLKCSLSHALLSLDLFVGIFLCIFYYYWKEAGIFTVTPTGCVFIFLSISAIHPPPHCVFATRSTRRAKQPIFVVLAFVVFFY